MCGLADYTYVDSCSETSESYVRLITASSCGLIACRAFRGDLVLGVSHDMPAIAAMRGIHTCINPCESCSGVFYEVYTHASTLCESCSGVFYEVYTHASTPVSRVVNLVRRLSGTFHFATGDPGTFSHVL